MKKEKMKKEAKEENWTKKFQKSLINPSMILILLIRSGRNRMKEEDGGGIIITIEIMVLEVQGELGMKEVLTMTRMRMGVKKIISKIWIS